MRISATLLSWNVSFLSNGLPNQKKVSLKPSVSKLILSREISAHYGLLIWGVRDQANNHISKQTKNP